MAYKNPKRDRPYKREYQLQLKRNEAPARRERERARDMFDRAGVDRTGKDIDHKVPLSKGGTNARSNLSLTSPSKNRSFHRNSDRSVKLNAPKK
jgi:5-methylcytosine-specific restriction endonuclease McrA